MIPRRIAILEANGSTDTSFDPGAGLNAAGHAVAALPDGRIVAGGEFTGAAGQSRSRLAVFEADGSLVATSLSADGTVRTLLAQADGKVLVGGSFETLAGSAKTRLARLLEDLTVEAAYAPAFNGAVHALAVQEDGKTLAGGDFTAIGEVSRSKLARLHNDEAPQRLEVVSVSLVRWLRGGSMPEAEAVTFEVDTGSGYGALGGTVERISGGWEVSGLSLSGDGTIRARAWPGDSHSAGMIEETAAFDIVPEIAVEALGDDLESADPLAFGSVQTGKSLDITITIRNDGLDDLTLTGGTPVTLSGTNADQWSVVSQPASPIAPGQSVNFTLRFSPTSDGVKVATLTIASDDDDEGSFTLSLSGTATPGPGSIDTAFQPVISNGSSLASVNALAVSNDAILIGGMFSAVNSQARKNAALLSHDGSVLAMSGTGANNAVHAALCLTDGKWLIGGDFTSFNGASRSRLARLNADGSLDTSFNRAANGPVYGLALQTDGRVIVTGDFTTLAGASRQRVARLNADGSLDADFNPAANDFVQSAAMQVNGKIILAGRFTAIGGLPVRGLARLNADGSLDATFTPPGTVTWAYRATVQPDGKVIAGSNLGVIRLLSSGATDDDWTIDVRDARVVDLQADGSLVVAGYVNGSLPNAPVHRYLTDGTDDTGFAQAAALSAFAAGILPSGAVLVGGSNVSGRRLAKLLNDAPESSLNIASPSEVQWLRGGAAAESAWVRFELSEDGGSTWTLLGLGSRVSGGWSLAGISLPRAGSVRARGSCGNGLQSELRAFSGLAVPDIQVEAPAGTVIVNGGSLSFPSMIPGQGVDVLVTLRNTGGATLTGLALSSSDAQFVVTSLGLSSLAAGQSTTAVVRFTPSAIGARAGQLTVASNVPGAKSSYRVNLSGFGIALPTAVTSTATSITSSAAALRGTVRANHPAARAFVEYRRAVDSVWTRSTETEVSGFANFALSVNVSGLSAGTAYRYRVGIYNSINTVSAPVYGAEVAFNTTA